MVQVVLLEILTRSIIAMHEFMHNGIKMYAPELSTDLQLGALGNHFNAIITKAKDCKRIKCKQCAFDNNKNYIAYLIWRKNNNVT